MGVSFLGGGALGGWRGGSAPLDAAHGCLLPGWWCVRGVAGWFSPTRCGAWVSPSWVVVRAGGCWWFSPTRCGAWLPPSWVVVRSGGAGGSAPLDAAHGCLPSFDL